MDTHRKGRLTATLAMVSAIHLGAIWLLTASQLRSVKNESGSLRLLSIARPPVPETTPAPDPVPRHTAKSAPQRPADPQDRALSSGPQSAKDDDATQSTPDWTEELRLAAKNAIARESAQDTHEGDFSHRYPKQPSTPEQFAWNYAATHRVESLPEGGILIHISDHCVLVFMPLPIVGCGIGKTPANGDLFQHLHN